MPDIWELIADEIVSGANVTEIAITGLDLGTDHAYKLIFTGKNAGSSNTDINLVYNNDLVSGNYYNQYILLNGAASTIARINFPTISFMRADNPIFIVVNIAEDPAGYPRALSFSNYDDPANVRLDVHAHIWNSTSNVTRIALRSGVANGIQIGSRLWLFKVRL